MTAIAFAMNEDFSPIIKKQLVKLDFPFLVLMNLFNFLRNITIPTQMQTTLVNV